MSDYTTQMNITECKTFNDYYPDPTSSIYVIAPFSVVYTLIFVLGIVGNVAIVHTTLHNRTLQSVQNLFMLNLSASDIVVCLLSLPITPITNIQKNWHFGPVLCRLIPCVQAVGTFISTFGLALIAVDRYILIVHPHRRPITRRRALILTVIMWIVSCVMTLPYGVFMDTIDYPNVCGEFCTEIWPNMESRRAYTLFVLSAQFVAPFLLMTFCYATIFYRLRLRARVRLQRIDERSQALEHTSSNNSTNIIDHAQADKRQLQVATWLEGHDRERTRLLAQTHRTTTILVSMVIVFGLSYLPHNIVSLIYEYNDSGTLFKLDDHTDLTYLANLFTHSIAMTSNVANPILYAWLNPTFRELVVQTCNRKRLKFIADCIRPSSESRRPSDMPPMPNAAAAAANSQRLLCVNGDFVIPVGERVGHSRRPHADDGSLLSPQSEDDGKTTTTSYSLLLHSNNNNNHGDVVDDIDVSTSTTMQL